MKVKLVHTLSIISFFLLINNLQGQEIEHKKIDRDYWQQTKKSVRADPSDNNNGYNDSWSENQDPDYGKKDGKGGIGKYKRELEREQRSISGPKDDRDIIQYEKDKKEQEEREFSNRNSGSLYVPSWVGYLFLSIIAIVLLFLLFKYFTGMRWGGNKRVPVHKNEKIIDIVDLPETELQRFLRELLQGSQYREAIRIWFIFIIKRLRELNYIRWEKKKTNMHYLREMQGRKEAPSFSKVTWLFERIWYGRMQLTKEQYEEVEPEFKNLLQQLEKGESIKTEEEAVIRE